jgi:DNA-binding PucR family transcriptional regulator
VLSGDRLVGVLNVQTDEPHDFTADQVSFMAAIAAQVAGALERSALQERLEEQIADLRRSEEIHRRFTALALTGGGLTAICAEIARQGGGAVALYDDEGERITPLGEDALPARLADAVRLRPRTDGLQVLPVRAGGEILGWLAVGPAEGVLQTARRRAHEHGVTVLALELSRERAAAEAENRLRGSLVEELLSTRMTEHDAARLAARAARLGYRLRRGMWVLAIEPDDVAAKRALSERTTGIRLQRALSAVAGSRHPGAMVVERAGSLVVLLPDAATSRDAERCALALLAAAGQLTGGASFSCGVSGERGGPVSLHPLFEEARTAVRVGRRLRRTGEVHPYQALGAERLLLEVDPPERLHHFVEEWLGPLLRQEAQGRSAAPLIDTIDAMAAASWSPRAAARRLNVHVNTLLYRVQRARELTGRDLDDPDVRLAFTLALRAHHLVGGAPAGGEDPPPRVPSRTPAASMAVTP